MRASNVVGSGRTKITVEVAKPDGSMVIWESMGLIPGGVIIDQTPVVNEGREVEWSRTADGRQAVWEKEPDTIEAIVVTITARLERDPDDPSGVIYRIVDTGVGEDLPSDPASAAPPAAQPACTDPNCVHHSIREGR